MFATSQPGIGLVCLLMFVVTIAQGQRDGEFIDKDGDGFDNLIDPNDCDPNVVPG